ncbi:hypothetical protein Hamer_G002998 [Homarus americanus]|uniref:Uncharacterized protein n=1 Tax=Homarus americanus TaxID=6706 RepID=A0A8J5JSY5_HOMAM|nr:hypothetical protein Hamer_G002998 [Homarus americanus]
MSQGNTPEKTLKSSQLPPTRTRPEILEELRGIRPRTRKKTPFLLVELDATGEGNQSEDVTEVAVPREDSEEIPVRRRQQRERRRPTKS